MDLFQSVQKGAVVKRVALRLAGEVTGCDSPVRISGGYSCRWARMANRLRQMSCVPNISAVIVDDADAP